MKLDLSPQEAWHPLPADQWNADAARHLLRRAGWSAQPDEVARALAEGLTTTLDRLFPAAAPLLPKPKLLENLEEAAPAYTAKLRAATSPEERQRIARELRERHQRATQDLAIKWLQFAARSGNAATEKWTLFLADIYVVSQEKVQSASRIHQHHEILRAHALGPAPALTKAVSRSPAMLRYLDVVNSRKTAPNENFARELFELFTLGEGNYSEQDIKQAARAFTGYRLRGEELSFSARDHDDGAKTVFGHTGRFTGDDIIDLAYRQPAAGRFLPRELAKFYLGDNPPADAYLATLGEWWTSAGHDLRRLAHRFFSSRLFFHPYFRANYIKRPTHFYLGLIQDLRLDVAPYPRHSLNTLRLMGEEPFRPPNVRGWVGGRLWINSGTLAARRQLVQTLFTPVDEEKLNADDRLELVAARSQGAGRITVADEHLADLARTHSADELATRLVTDHLPIAPSASVLEDLKTYIAGETTPSKRVARLRTALVTLLQSPEYQLC